MERFVYSFASMVSWYRGLKTNLDGAWDLFVIDGAKYKKSGGTPTRPSGSRSAGKIRKDSGRQAKFLNPGIIHACKVTWLNDAELYPNGVYFLQQRPSKGRQDIFFVFPRWKKNDNGQSALVADHYSFMSHVSKGVIDFHATLYTPDPFDIQDGSVVHKLFPSFRDNITLPRMIANDSNMATIPTEFTPKLAGLSSKHIFNLCAAYHTMGGGSRSGRKGSKSQTTLLSPKRMRYDLKYGKRSPGVRMQALPPRPTVPVGELERLLTSLNIETIRAFCMKARDEWHCTIFVIHERDPDDDSYAIDRGFYLKYATRPTGPALTVELTRLLTDYAQELEDSRGMSDTFTDSDYDSE